MVRASIRCSACFGVTATVAAPLLFNSQCSPTALTLPTSEDSGGYALLTPGEIAKAAGFKVGNGKAGKALGVQGRCIRDGPGPAEEVIVVLADSRHTQIKIAVMQSSGGTEVAGIGSKAVGNKNLNIVGDYLVLVQDAKGGSGVNTGRGGTRDIKVALAKIVKSHR